MLGGPSFSPWSHQSSYGPRHDADRTGYEGVGRGRRNLRLALLAVAVLAAIVAVVGSVDSAIGILIALFAPLAVIALVVELVASFGHSRLGDGWDRDIDW